MLLLELFKDAKTKMHWYEDHGKIHGLFKLGDVEYVIQFMHLKNSPSDPILRELKKRTVTDHTWFFSFAAKPKGGNLTDRETDARQSIKVFSIVMQRLEKFVATKNVDMLFFGCTTGKENRRTLYQRLVDRYCSKHGWEVIDEENAKFWGDEKHLWIVKKK